MLGRKSAQAANQSGSGGASLICWESKAALNIRLGRYDATALGTRNTYLKRVSPFFVFIDHSGEGGGVNQTYSWLSTTHGHITECKLDTVVYAGVCMVIQCGPVLFGPNDLARQFWVPSRRFNSATGEQKGITQTIYTDSEPPNRMPNSLMPSAKLRSANLTFFTSLGRCDGRGSNPGLPHPERTL